MTRPELSIVVAVRDGADNIPAILQALQTAAEGTEIIFCIAGTCPAALERHPRITVLGAPADSLVPHLWRDGIRHARARRVAVTTAQCVPAHDWASRLLAADIDRWAAIGGAIDNDPKAHPANWALYFLRYLPFAPPLQAGEVDEVAADNAVYDRELVLKNQDLLDEGFWEPLFHARFRSVGGALLLDPSLMVVHHGLIRPREFVAQRHSHGRQYGFSRSIDEALGKRLLLLGRCLLLPPLMMARIALRLRHRPRFLRHLPLALPWLTVFILAWASGEARGYAQALGGRRVAMPRLPSH